MRMLPSKDKERVRRRGLKNGKKYLWQDTNHIWHAATNSRKIPWAQAIKTQPIHTP